ncbi:MAG: RloB domain-containing protein [Spirochaetales bacterium]|nr:RloB domain-containing protein [Spirochaetales bacterium]
MRRKRVNENPRQTLLIVTASQSEALYFSQMRKDCRYTNMSVIWAEEARDLEEFIRIAARERIKGRFDKTWGLFSFDHFELSSDQVREVLPYAKKRKIELAWVNPGIGLWYLLHLQSPRAPVTDNGVIERSLQGVLPNFNLTPDYLLGDGDSLHLRLFPAKAQAVVNAGAYNTIFTQDYRGSLAPVNMTKLTTEIGDICGVADMTYNQKMIGLKNN